MDINIESLKITSDILALISEVNEFKGAWRALDQLVLEQLSALKQVATIERIGSFTHIKGIRLSDREVEELLSNLSIKKFSSLDEQEVAEYSDVMNLVFQNHGVISLQEAISNNYTQDFCSTLTFLPCRHLEFDLDILNAPFFVSLFDLDY